MVPGRWPLLGHTPAMLRRRLDFSAGLSAVGDVVRIYLGKRVVYVVTTPQLACEVLAAETCGVGKGLPVGKFRKFFGNRPPVAGGDCRHGERKAVQAAFHPDRVVQYCTAVTKGAAELVDSWRPGQVLEIDRVMRDFAIATVDRMLLATDSDPEVDGEIRRWTPELIRHGVARVLPLPRARKLVRPVDRRFDEAVGRVHAAVDRAIASARADPVERQDPLRSLLSARDSTGRVLSDRQVRDEVVTLLVAGSGTTGPALAWLFHELARHPEVQRRVQTEADEVLRGRPATIGDLPRLRYLRRVVNEVLRRYPLWFVVRRTAEDLVLAGVRVPAGAEVAFSPHALHHDERFHRDPWRFDPDRWSPERAGALPRGAYLPFAGGAHRCPGHAYATAGIAIVAATTAARWRLVPVPGKSVRTKVVGTIHPGRMPMAALPRPRTTTL
ncbi:cytochrome P450 [Saccharothrix coeruleofusca]|uniref:Cytochrome P450 n=1 Tax=Saccharothrix coeruleofusca TaxID=33919 RepID=A0A918ATF3_9PSEU|nr:cytochrome P450 [Saccharothrix coeruleofusca]